MMRLPWRGRTVPHAVVDIIRGCNCRCADCYNAASPRAKPLDDVKAEVRVIRAARNVKTISLSGGEPLLHPQVCDIVAYLRREEKVSVSTLTNGILFDDAMAERLRAAGLDFVTFHIQRGQTRPDCDDARVDALRREKGRIARAHGIYPAVVETIRADDSAGFAALGRFLRGAPECTRSSPSRATSARSTPPSPSPSPTAGRCSMRSRARGIVRRSSSAAASAATFRAGMSCRARRPWTPTDASARGTWCVRGLRSGCSSAATRFSDGVRSTG